MKDLLLDERTIECIVERLALAESVSSIARTYGIAKTAVRLVRKQKKADIVTLQRAFIDRMAAKESLAAVSNQIVFLGFCARRALKDDRIKDAKDCVLAISTILRNARRDRSNIIDLNIMDEIQKGNWELALDRIGQEESRDEPEVDPKLLDFRRLENRSPKYEKPPDIAPLLDRALAERSSDTPPEISQRTTGGLLAIEKRLVGGA